jgi:thiamine pyrophosphokinase
MPAEEAKPLILPISLLGTPEEGFLLRAVIFANGILNFSQETSVAIRPGDLLIAADGGAQNCLALGLTPAVVIGDLDSLSPDQLENLQVKGARFVVHPRDKDQTDLELALRYAIEQGAREILLLGLLGGRLDQTLANLLLLARPDWNDIRLSTVEGPDTAHILRAGDTITLLGQVGDIVSLIPLSPKVSSVTTQGLRWPLRNAELSFGSTLGISNKIVATNPRIQIEAGELLVVHRRAGAPD